MSQDIIFDTKRIANAKGVGEEEAFNIIEVALSNVIENKLGKGVKVHVMMNRRTGNYKIFRQWTIVDDDIPSITPEAALNQMPLTQAKKHDTSLEPGQQFEELVTPLTFNRSDVLAAKQFILQGVRKAERASIANLYLARIGETLMGTVSSITRDGVTLEVSEDVEAFLPRDQIIPKEEIRLRDRLRVYLYSVDSQARGPQLFVSRTSPEMLVALFKLQVMEVSEEVIEIKRIARDPGARAKIAVKTNDGRIDPIGMCIGMRGERVQAISKELNGEHIDIVLWDENPAQLAIHALTPAEVSSIVMDEETYTMDVAVPAEQLSRAIGRNGQNVRLASILTGWTINVMSIEEAEKKNTEESSKLVQSFVDQLEIETSLAETLVEQGFSTIEEIAYISPAELITINGLEETQVANLQSQAKNLLLSNVLAAEKHNNSSIPEAFDLNSLKNMDASLIALLAEKNITTREMLAELSVDDLLELVSLERNKAEKLIIEARAHWFKDA